VSKGNLCRPQPVQLDCRVSNCKHNKSGGYCIIEPMITLGNAGEHTCWSSIKREPEIKACPLCGGEASVFETLKKEYGYVQCLRLDCFIKTDKYDNAIKAIEHWNSLPRRKE